MRYTVVGVVTFLLQIDIMGLTTKIDNIVTGASASRFQCSHSIFLWTNFFSSPTRDLSTRSSSSTTSTSTGTYLRIGPPPARCGGCGVILL